MFQTNLGELHCIEHQRVAFRMLLSCYYPEVLMSMFQIKMEKLHYISHHIKAIRMLLSCYYPEVLMSMKIKELHYI